MTPKERVIAEGMRKCMKDVLVRLPKEFASDDRLKGFMDKVKDDDAHNELYLALCHVFDRAFELGRQN